MWVRLAVAVPLLAYVGYAVAKRRATLGGLTLVGAFALAVLASAWSPGLALALLLVALAAAVTDIFFGARELRATWRGDDP